LSQTLQNLYEEKMRFNNELIAQAETVSEQV